MYRNQYVEEIGLSLLVWGTLFVLPVHTPGTWFIPTCVRNVHQPAHRDNQPSVYPHSRGEHILNECAPVAGRSLSPLTRGTRQSVKTVIFVVAVYPHSRGEHKAMAKAEMFLNGLSPLARGTLRHGALGWAAIRVNPTLRAMPFVVPLTGPPPNRARLEYQAIDSQQEGKRPAAGHPNLPARVCFPRRFENQIPTRYS